MTLKTEKTRPKFFQDFQSSNWHGTVVKSPFLKKMCVLWERFPVRRDVYICCNLSSTIARVYHSVYRIVLQVFVLEGVWRLLPTIELHYGSTCGALVFQIKTCQDIISAGMEVHSKFIPSVNGYQWLPWVWHTHTHPTTQQKSKRDYDLANLLGNFKYDSSGRVANWGMFPCHASWRTMWSSCWSCIQHHRTIGFHNWGYDMVWTNQFFFISGADWLWL